MPRKPPKPEGVPATPRYKPRTNVSKPTIGTKKTLRTNETPSKDEIHELIAELGHGSDRACAIITAVMLELVLTNAILVKLDNIDGKTAPLARLEISSRKFILATHWPYMIRRHAMTWRQSGKSAMLLRMHTAPLPFLMWRSPPLVMS
jgi:hypothetical protein